MSVRYILPFPPSINGYWRSFRGRQIISARGRKYRADVVAMLRQFGTAPIEHEVSVVIHLYPPDRRRRDVDNYSKSALDALTHAGVWADDYQVRKLTTERFAPVKGGMAHIIVSDYEEAA